MDSGEMFFCLSRQTAFYTFFDSLTVFYDKHISLSMLPSSLFPLLIPQPAPFSCSQPALFVTAAKSPK